MKKFLFYLASFTWCILQTLIGAILFIFNARKKHYIFHGAIDTEWKYQGSVSLGAFIFIYKDQPKYEVLKHEYGHTIQSLILGPLFLFVIGFSSSIWCGCFRKYRLKPNISYYKFYTESWTNKLIQKYLK